MTCSNTWRRIPARRPTRPKNSSIMATIGAQIDVLGAVRPSLYVKHLCDILKRIDVVEVDHRLLVHLLKPNRKLVSNPEKQVINVMNRIWPHEMKKAKKWIWKHLWGWAVPVHSSGLPAHSAPKCSILTWTCVAIVDSLTDDTEFVHLIGFCRENYQANQCSIIQFHHRSFPWPKTSKILRIYLTLSKTPTIISRSLSMGKSFIYDLLFQL